ncbi:hypothetical protein LXA47_25395 [Massilia sp. P8910]|uniref:hypothetical protein n=1 Tax=Massilia antarctica TaxID=2765360 RepID=UPI001E34851C|nr:hypothetical protein [Massilia antarctica]MCE3606914.1 hypothetical protein [Massilia antarctica]
MFIDPYYMILDVDKATYALEPGEPGDYIYEIAGRVIGINEVCRRVVAGRFKAIYVDVLAAEMARISTIDLFDANATTLEYFYSIYGSDGSQFAGALTGLLDDEPYWGNILIIDRLEILPKFRAHNLGLVAMRRIIERFRPGAEIVAIKPFPLQNEAFIGNDAAWRARLDLSNFKGNQARAMAKLRRHYAKLGFKQLRGTEFMFLFGGAILPGVADLEK